MDLWIRSQDRENTVKIINGYGLKYNDKKTIIANYIPDFSDNYDGSYDVLGTYESKQRALEVLDEIQEILKPKTIIKFNEKEVYDEKENMVISTLFPYETFDIKQLSTYVYEMPID